jgi:hypothetical protein
LLLEALAILYSHEKKYDKALAMYLKWVSFLFWKANLRTPLCKGKHLP